MNGRPPIERFVERLVAGGSRVGTALLVLVLMLPLFLPPAVAAVLLILLL